MPVSVTMPQLGESVTEGTVTRWLKQEGDPVDGRRAAARGLDRQGRHRDPVTRRGRAAGDRRPARTRPCAVGAELAVIGAARRGRRAGGHGARSPGCRTRPPLPQSPRPPRLPLPPQPQCPAPPAAPAPPAPPAAESPAPAPAPRRSGAGDVRGDAGAGRVRHRGHRHPLAQAGRRRGRGRRAAARGLHRQGRHRDPVAGRRHPAGDQGRRGRDRRGRRQLAVIGAPRSGRTRPGACCARPQRPAPLRHPRRACRRPGRATPVAAAAPAVAAAARRSRRRSPRPPPHPLPAAARSGADDRVRHAAGPQARRRARRRPRHPHRHRRRRPDPQAGRARRRRRAPRPPRRRRPRGRSRRPPPAAAPPQPPPRRRHSPLRGRTEKMSRLRRVIATRMVESLQVSAQLTTVVEVDVTRIASCATGSRPTSWPARASSCPSCRSSPWPRSRRSSTFPDGQRVASTSTAGTVTYHDAEHLGIAVDTERGLLVPVIRTPATSTSPASPARSPTWPSAPAPTRSARTSCPAAPSR